MTLAFLGPLWLAHTREKHIDDKGIARALNPYSFVSFLDY